MSQFVSKHRVELSAVNTFQMQYSHPNDRLAEHFEVHFLNLKLSFIPLDVWESLFLWSQKS